MISKEKLINQIESFPEELSIDALIDKLIFIDKLEKRIQKSEKGETISEEAVKKEMNEWFK